MQAETVVERRVVTVLQSASVKHLAAYLKFQQQVKKEQASFHDNDNLDYYLVAVDFLADWRNFCESTEQSRISPDNYNDSLFDQGVFRNDLIEGSDFQIIAQQQHEIIGNFIKNQNILKRKAYFVGQDKKVPIKTFPLDYALLKRGKVREVNKEIEESRLKNQPYDHIRLDLTFETVQMGNENELDQIFQDLINNGALDAVSQNHRLWRMPDTFNDALLRALLDQAVKLKGEVDCQGELIEEFEAKIGQAWNPANIPADASYRRVLIIESKKQAQKWTFKGTPDRKCSYCYRNKTIVTKCRCNQVFYCSDACKKNNERYHNSDCPILQEEALKKSMDMSITNHSSLGLVGLNNLGNTCFMNSCLQCLSHTMPLTQYFLERSFEHQINRVNPIGSKGQLANNYARFIKGMWCEANNVFSPHDLKYAVSRLNPMFSGYQQHDAHEFFSFIVDGLHEDLNRILKKPVVPSVENQDKDDNTLAQESWLNYLKRNQSQIVDLMTGQFKSKVTCANCKKESVTFDPFTTVSVPIPSSSLSRLQFFVIYSNMVNPSIKTSITFSSLSDTEIIGKMSAEVGIAAERLLVVLTCSTSEMMLLKPDNVSEFIEKHQSYKRYIFAMQLTEQEASFKDPLILTMKFTKKGYYETYENAWFKFPLVFDSQKPLLGRDVVRRALTFIYEKGYNDKDTVPLQQYLDAETDSMFVFLKYPRYKDSYYSSYQNEIKWSLDEPYDEVLKQIPSNQRFDVEIRVKQNCFNFKKFNQCDDLVKNTHVSSSNSFTLEECLQHMERAQRLVKGNEWYCPRCKTHNLATKELQIYKAPQILILQLSRFKQKGQHRKEKNEAEIIFKDKLNLKSYVVDPTPMSTYNAAAVSAGVYVEPKVRTKISNSGNDAIYQLYATSNHSGGLGGGHYTAFARNKKDWHYFNDSSVRKVGPDSVNGSSSYLLFYERIG